MKSRLAVIRSILNPCLSVIAGGAREPLAKPRLVYPEQRFQRADFPGESTPVRNFSEHCQSSCALVMISRV